MRNHIETKRYVIPRGRRSASASLACLFAFLFFGLSACGETTAKPKAGETVPAISDKTLYVTNGNGGKLLAFDVRVLGGTLTVDGTNIPPTRQFPDVVSSPAGLFLDRANDTLYVANSGQNAIQIYDNASTLTAPLTASRIISGDFTQLDQPFGLAFDATSGRLFVANKDGNSIVVFCIGTSGSGNIAPCNLLVGELTQLDSPRALTLDPQRKRLYISNMGNNAILVYENSDSIGAAAAQCASDFSPCNIAPTSVIAPHTGTENASKLNLPFGIYISPNDRLYVANTGLNRPAVLIYDNASTLNGSPVPERVLTGLNTLLTVPAGIDVDATTGRLFVLNNNSPNNVNTSPEGNTDSPSLLIFNDILTTCTLAMHLCDLSPDRKIGGDVSPQVGNIVTNPQRDTLTNAQAVAFDALRDVTYVSNTGGNSIIVYSVEGNIAPFKTSAGANTLLDVPSSFFYDATLDRLYVTNAGAGREAFIVYDQLSTQALGNTPPSWQLRRTSNFERPMGLYIDKTRNLMLVLNAVDDIRRGLYVYDLTEEFRDLVSPDNIVFPVNDAIGPTGKTLLAPVHQSKSFDGLSTDGGPTSMAVDELRGEVYVADKTNNSVVIYDLASPPVGGALTRLRTITGFNKPSGLFLDADPADINVPATLYVTNNGEEPGALADYRANTVFVFEAAETKGDGTAQCPSSPCPPDRIISTVGLSAGVQNKLKAPISPYVDAVADRLYLINSASDQNAILSFNRASTIGDGAAACIAGSADCSDTPPAKVIIGPDTNLNFTNTGVSFTGAVLLSRFSNNETLYVGQPLTPLCTAPCSTQGGLLVFGSEGQLAPSKIWSGGGASFSTPEAVTIDSARNVLYVASQDTNTLSVFANADKIDVTLNVNTGKRDLSNIQLNRPAGLVADTIRDRLYVSNSEASTCTAGPCNAILVFNNASTFADAATPPPSPSQILTDAALNQPQGLALNPTNNRLYVANTGGNTVLIYNQADILNGAVTADVTLGGLSQVLDVALDVTRDLLYVLNRGTKEIWVFENASSLTSTETPARIISGDDGFGNNAMVDPKAIFLDADNDLLYLADPGENSVSVYTTASKASGQAPKKTFAGDQTGLQNPSTLTLGIPAP